jgi:nicotinamidase-related amidase
MGRTALIVVDMLSSYDFEDAEMLIPAVRESLPRMAELRERALAEGASTIYVNDNYGDWHSNRNALLAGATEGEHADLVEPIAPGDDSLFIFKARHSIFFQTPLEYLLGQLDVDRLVLIGQVTEQCILYSALDAYIRHLQVCVPRDAVASIHPHLAEAALELMERNMGAEVCDAAKVEFGDR